MKNIKLPGVAGIACLVVMAGAGLDAAPFIDQWNNGSLNTTFNNSAPTDNNNTGFTVFDNFTVSGSGWLVTQFDITDFFISTNTSEYSSTNWSIWKGDPLQGGTLMMASGSVGSIGNVVGNCSSASGCYATITVTLSSGIFLAASNTPYYLGTSNVLKSNTDETYRAFTVAGSTETTTGGANAIPQLTGWETSSGGISGSSWAPQGCNSTTCFATSDTAFDILGSPEPCTLLLMGFVLLGLGYKVRRRTT